MESVLRDPMTSKRQKNRPATWKLRCQHQSLKLHSVFLPSVSSESLPVITTACSLKWMSRWLVWVTDVCHMTQSELTVSDKAKINHGKCAEAACIAHPPQILSHSNRASSQKTASTWFSETIKGVHTGWTVAEYQSVCVVCVKYRWSSCWP